MCVIERASWCTNPHRSSCICLKLARPNKTSARNSVSVLHHGYIAKGPSSLRVSSKLCRLPPGTARELQQLGLAGYFIPFKLLLFPIQTEMNSNISSCLSHVNAVQELMSAYRSSLPSKLIPQTIPCYCSNEEQSDQLLTDNAALSVQNDPMFLRSTLSFTGPVLQHLKMEVESLSARWIENNGGYAAHGKIIFKGTRSKAVEHKVAVNVYKIYLFTLQLLVSISEL